MHAHKNYCSSPFPPPISSTLNLLPPPDFVSRTQLAIAYTILRKGRNWLQAADELSPYRISVDAAEARRIEEGALNEEKKLEAGAYGYVYKVGVERIAKKLHRNLTNRSEVSAREVDSVEAIPHLPMHITLRKKRMSKNNPFLGYVHVSCK